MQVAEEREVHLDAAKEAAGVLSAYWPEGRYPVDPVVICRRMGLQVYESILPDKVSGALIKDEGKEPVVALHRDDHPNRKRFTCAHELGHYVLRINQFSESEIESYSHVDLRAGGEGKEEFFANRFAACLLMPASDSKDFWRSSPSLVQFAGHFGVSAEAAKIRLSSLKLV